MLHLILFISFLIFFVNIQVLFYYLKTAFKCLLLSIKALFNVHNILSFLFSILVQFFHQFHFSRTLLLLKSLHFQFLNHPFNQTYSFQCLIFLETNLYHLNVSHLNISWSSMSFLFFNIL